MFAPFADPQPKDIEALVAAYPLAWVVTRQFNASPLPLIAEHDEAGEIVSLIGHCGKRNLIVEDLRADPAALILFNGPSGYISNRMVSEPNWGPTWNYAAVRFHCDVEFVENETETALDRLLDHVERDYDDRWHVDQLGDRYAAMLAQIIAFRAHVVSVHPTFKLGQDERPEIFREIVDRIEDDALAAAMQASR